LIALRLTSSSFPVKPTSNADSRLPSSATTVAKADALIELLAPVLQQMPLAWVQERRRQFMPHFAGCGGSFAVCERVLGFLDEHIASRASTLPDDASLENVLATQPGDRPAPRRGRT
jgi:hypothetical protein